MIKRTHITKSFFLFLILVLLTGISGCNKDTSKKTAAASSVKSFALPQPQGGVYYSLFVRSFADSDGDGTGDFDGITEHLDYLYELGIRGLWLLPVFPSPSYHGYDVDDYYDVNPDYGSMQDFEELLAACKAKGISVMLDITFNHSSSTNKWFIASKNPQDPHRAWYHWISENPENDMTDNASKYNLNANIWGHKLWNKAGNGYYAGEFFDGMPDYNLDCPELREELKKVLAFWMDKGVSGFRFDAAGHIYDKIKMPAGFDDSTGASARFWKEIIDFTKSKNSQTYSVAEVWDTTSIRAQSLMGLDSVFHFDLGDNYILNTIKNQSAGNNNLAHIIQNDLEAYKKYNANFIDAPFLTNHDQARLAGNLKGDKASLKLAAGMYLLTPGIPFVYYGEELGMMSGTKDETKRTPFLWTGMDSKKKPEHQTSWAAEADCIYNKKTTGLDLQKKDKDSLYNYYKKIINFRNSCKAFAKDSQLLSYDTGNSVISSWIVQNKENTARALVLHNVSTSPVELALPVPAAEKSAGQNGFSGFPDRFFDNPAFSTNPVKKNKDGTFLIPPQTSLVFTDDQLLY